MQCSQTMDGIADGLEGTRSVEPGDGLEVVRSSQIRHHSGSEGLLMAMTVLDPMLMAMMGNYKVVLVAIHMDPFVRSIHCIKTRADF